MTPNATAGQPHPTRGRVTAAIACSILMAAGYGYWRMNARNAEQSAFEPGSGAVASPFSTAAKSSIATPQSLEELVHWKYRYLLADLDANAPELLPRLLLEYEQTVAHIESAERSGMDTGMLEELNARLAEIDNELRRLLHWSHYEQYKSLSHSDAQQRQLVEYSGGISNVAPLDEQIERALFEAKLRHKEAYEAALVQSGLDRTTLSAEERRSAHAALASALNEYRDNFLIEARSLLNDQQYELLSSYETTEFSRLLSQQQMLINGK